MHPIWVDAVCLNQSDEIEKSWQVGQMGDVYAGASQTLIFLGPASTHSDEAMHVLDLIGGRIIDYGMIHPDDWTNIFDPCMNRIMSNFNELSFLDKFAADEPITSTQDSDVPLDTFIYYILRMELAGNIRDCDFKGITLTTMVTAIMERPWWKGVWVLQELFLSASPVMICGHRKINPEHLVAALFLFRSIASRTRSIPHSQLIFPFPQFVFSYYKGPNQAYMDIPAVDLYNHRIWHASRNKTRVPLGLTEILHLVGLDYLSATDSRDVIYALLAIVNIWPPDIQKVHSDYTLSCAQVYVNMTIHLLAAGHTQGLRAALIPKRQKHLPSWVPDWSVNSSSAYFNLMVRTDNLEHAHSVDPRGHNVLAIPGRSLGPVRLLLPGYSFLMHNDDQFSFDSAGPTGSAYVTHFRAYLLRVGHTLQEMGADAIEHQKFTNMLALGIILSKTHLGVDRCTPAFIEDAYDKLEWIAEDENPNSIGNMVHIFVNTINATYSPNHATLTLLPNDRIAEIGALALDERTEALAGTTARLQSLIAFEIQELKHESIATSSITAQVLYAASATMETQAPFLCRGKTVGIAANNIRDGDVLARFDMDPDVIFVLRLVEDDMFELLVRAWVPELMTVESHQEGEVRQFRLR